MPQEPAGEWTAVSRRESQPFELRSRDWGCPAIAHDAVADAWTILLSAKALKPSFW